MKIILFLIFSLPLALFAGETQTIEAKVFISADSAISLSKLDLIDFSSNKPKVVIDTAVPAYTFGDFLTEIFQPRRATAKYDRLFDLKIRAKEVYSARVNEVFQAYKALYCIQSNLYITSSSFPVVTPDNRIEPEPFSCSSYDVFSLHLKTLKNFSTAQESSQVIELLDSIIDETEEFQQAFIQELEPSKCFTVYAPDNGFCLHSGDFTIPCNSRACSSIEY